MHSILCICLLALLPLANGQTEPFLTGCEYTEYYSEESGYPSDVLDGYPVTGLRCSGSYCDSLSAQQCTTVTDGTDSFDLFTQQTDCEDLPSTFSEEGGDGNCPDGRFVEKMKCEGSYCDNILLTCCESINWSVDYGSKTNTPEFSDEGGQLCPDMNVVIGASCTGKDCDTMTLICAPIIAPAFAGQSFGKWLSVCSSNAHDQSCQFTPSESVTRERQTTWNSNFVVSVHDSISTNVVFRGEPVGLKAEVTKSVDELVIFGENKHRTCSAKLEQKTNNSSEKVWWQWVMNVNDVSMTDSASEHKQLHVTTCFFQQTSGFDKVPKCTPGNCADQDCQVCI